MGAPGSGRTAAAAAALGTVQAVQAVLLRPEAAYLSVLLAATAASGLAGAAVLWWRRGFPARLTLVLVALLSLLVEGLLVSLGLPGIGHATARAGLTVTGCAAMACAVAVLALLHRSRGATLRPFS